MAVLRGAAAGAASEDPPEIALLALSPPADAWWHAGAADEVAEAQLLAALAAPNGWASGGAGGGTGGSAPKRQKLSGCANTARQASSQLSGGAGAASLSLASSRASEGEEVATAGGLRLRSVRQRARSGVRFQGSSWQARTKRAGREVSLGLYSTAEEAGMAYDLDRLQQQGAKAQRLNYPLLRRTYKEVLARLAAAEAEADAAEAAAAAEAGLGSEQQGGVDPAMYRRVGELDSLAIAVTSAARAAQHVPGVFSEHSRPAAVSRSMQQRRAAES
ncbi:hypothetical protein ABPG75_011976 [Micractinium tetrahymenae]